VKHSVSNGKRHVSNVNKRAKMFAVCAWTQIAVCNMGSKLNARAFLLGYDYIQFFTIFDTFLKRQTSVKSIF
jgi:hypothetical protein